MLDAPLFCCWDRCIVDLFSSSLKCKISINLFVLDWLNWADHVGNEILCSVPIGDVLLAIFRRRRRSPSFAAHIFYSLFYQTFSISCPSSFETTERAVECHRRGRRSQAAQQQDVASNAIAGNQLVRAIWLHDQHGYRWCLSIASGRFSSRPSDSSRRANLRRGAEWITTNRLEDSIEIQSTRKLLRWCFHRTISWWVQSGSSSASRQSTPDQRDRFNHRIERQRRFASHEILASEQFSAGHHRLRQRPRRSPSTSDHSPGVHHRQCSRHSQRSSAAASSLH